MLSFSTHKMTAVATQWYKITLWVREMAQREFLLYKHEDMSSDPKYTHKRMLQYMPGSPKGMEAESGRYWDSAS